MTTRIKKEGAVHPEPERRFLVLSAPPEMEYAKEPHGPYAKIQQSYLFTRFPTTRVRVVQKFGANSLPEGPARAYLTIKTRPTPENWQGQQEFEIEIPLSIGQAYIVQRDLPYIPKFRRMIPGGFEFDTFMGVLYGLSILEIELKKHNEKIVTPEGFEVIEITDDRRFGNAQLALIKTNGELKALIASVVEGHKNATT